MIDYSKIFSISLVYAAFRSATPIIYAALCACITQQAGILNIGTEGIMLMGAFMAVAVSYLTGSWLLGVLAAMLSGLLIAMIIGVGHIKFGAEITAIGIGVNMFVIAFTKYLLNSILGKSGSFADPAIVGIPKVNIPFIENNEVLNALFNNWSITEWFVIVCIILLNFVLFKTVWGLRLRSVGKMPLAAKSVGINIDAMRYQSLAIGGLIGGLAGAHLSLAYSQLFRENMTNGRGFMGVAAMYFGSANPIVAAIGCLVFGFSDSVGARLQAYGVPSQFVLLMPYVVTVGVLFISMATKLRREKKNKSSLKLKKELG